MPVNLRPGADRPAWARTIIARRRALGLTQREVADLAGVAERTVIAIERGSLSPSVGRLLDVLRVLGLHLQLARGQGGTITAGDGG